MNCKLSNDYMMKYFDKDINDIENAQFKQHLRTCCQCSREFESMNEIFKTLETADFIEPPDNFEEMVMNKVKAVDIVKDNKKAWTWFSLYNLAAAAAVILTALFILDLYGMNMLKFIDRFADDLDSIARIGHTIYMVLKNLYGVIAEIASIMLVLYVLVRIKFMDRNTTNVRTRN